MKQPKIISALIILTVVLSAVWLVFSDRPVKQSQFQAQLSSERPSQETTALPSLAEEPAAATALLLVDEGAGQRQTFTIELNEEITAFDLLQESGLDIAYQVYDGLGVLVERIADKENGQDNQYWLYYLNGQMPGFSCDQQLIEAGDEVEFRFEESVF